MKRTSLQRAVRSTSKSRWTTSAARTRGVLRLVRRKAVRRGVFQSAPHYDAVEAAVLVALAAYFAVGAVAIVFGRTT
jgi:hypothetical protein